MYRVVVVVVERASNNAKNMPKMSSGLFRSALLVLSSGWMHEYHVLVEKWLRSAASPCAATCPTIARITAIAA